VKLFSWNVNGLRAVISKGEWQKFIETYQPDIIGLQEIKAKVDQIDEDPADGYFKYYNSADKPGYAGTAIFSKIKPIQVLFDLPKSITNKFNLVDEYGNLNSEGRVTTAEFTNFWFVTVYTPNTKRDLTRLNIRQTWDEAFLAYIKELEKTKPVVVCGDLNVAHKEIDLANPEPNRGNAGFTDEERVGFDNFVSAKLIDTFREFSTEPGQYSWWTHWAKARERNIGWRIDYFLISKAFRPRLKSAAIHQEQMGSDHCPVSIEID
jgi:exodeoxyribonuclease-3